MLAKLVRPKQKNVQGGVDREAVLVQINVNGANGRFVWAEVVNVV